MRPASSVLALSLLLLGLSLSASASPDAAWVARAQQGLAEREYQASENAQGLQAPNRAHNLRTWFENAGIRVHDRTAGGSPELLRLALAAVGRGEKTVAVAPGEDVIAHESRVEIRRPGLVEWYVNSPDGLEQGFTLAERPVGEGPLVLELAVAGASAQLRGDTVVFETGAQRKLRYGALAAADAAGRALPTRFEVPAADRLRIVVEDTGAPYPLVIDPLLTAAPDAQLESDQIGAEFGTSVAAAGDVNGDGYADLLVGAPFYDAGQADEGAAFVFLGSATGIAYGNPTTASAQLESDQAFATLGGSVAGAGDVNGDGYADVIVGAQLYDAGEPEEGAAFVFLGSAAGIADGTPATAAAQLESDQAAAFLGASVAGAGDVNGDGYADVIVGARYDAGEIDEGAAFVFLGSAAGIADGNASTAAARLESDQVSAELGASVAGAGDVNGDGYADVVVGAPLYDDGAADEGLAFVFLGGAAGIADGTPATAAATLASDQLAAELGRSVAAAGDVNGDGYADLIVGAPFYDAGASDEGAAFVFLGSAAGIADATPATAAAQLESDQAFAALGGSVAGAGDVDADGYADVIVGARFYDAGEAEEGAAFVFHGSATGVADGTPSTALAQLESDQAAAFLGGSVAGIGDVNGDGYADVAVGMASYDEGEADEGGAFVFLGGSAGVLDGTPATAAARLEGNQNGAFFGWCLAAAGDVNGDGYGDVIVGAPTYDAGQTDEGAAFVFHGSAAGIVGANPATAATRLESNQVGAQLGDAVAGAGDVNGDGYADVIASARFYDAGQSNEGAAFVFLGRSTGIPNSTPATPGVTTLQSNQANAQFGDGLAGAGDVNGDGYADVIVGAPNYTAGQTLEGAAFVFFGSQAGVEDANPSTPGVAQLESNAANAILGFNVAGAGDVNGDGYADVIVGAPHYPPTQAGAAFVFLGSATGIADGNPATAATRLTSSQANGSLGFSVWGAGDVNGDGYSDVIVGAPFYDALQHDEGAAFVFQGNASGIPDATPATAAAQLETNQVNAQLGASVMGVGDVNGDGYADVIAGSIPAALVFHGSASGIPDGSTATAATRLQGFGEVFNTAAAGDVNGDGFADVIVSDARFDGPETNEGAVYLFLGGGDGHGRLVTAQQQRSTIDLPIQPQGVAHSQTDFRVRVRATHPEGRGRVKLAVEYCAPGVGFGHASCGSELGTSWTDVTATSGGVTLTQSVDGLSANAGYRWRARVLYAPFQVVQAGISAPPNPAHGPWRRLSASADGMPDVRMRIQTAACADGLDNDFDGGIDFNPACNGFPHPVGDCGCATPADASERDQTGTYPCDNGKDDDFDDGIDFDPVTRADAPTFSAGFGDPGCQSPTWFREDPECQDLVSNDPGQDSLGLKDFDGGQSVFGACAGGVCPAGVSDWNADGVADPDPQCMGQPWKNKERTGCGLGFELALVVPALAALRRRRDRARTR